MTLLFLASTTLLLRQASPDSRVLQALQVACCRPALRVKSFSVLQSQSASCESCSGSQWHRFWDDTASCSIRWRVPIICQCLAQVLNSAGSCQFSQYCSCVWAIRQLAFESPIRRKIRQYRHAFGYARSATMTDGSLPIVFLSQWKWSHELNTSH